VALHECLSDFLHTDLSYALEEHFFFRVHLVASALTHVEVCVRGDVVLPMNDRVLVGGNGLPMCRRSGRSG
jgi:hypothetical protein